MKTLPLHVISRQAEILPQLISAVDAAVRERPADRFLSDYYRKHREFGGRDRRLFSGMVFAWFRWRGWLSEPDNVTPTNLVAVGMLDGLTPHPTLDWMAEQAQLSTPPALTNMTLTERARSLQSYLNLPAMPAVKDLMPDWFADRLFYPPDTAPEHHLTACVESLQARPATWARVDRHAPRPTPSDDKHDGGSGLIAPAVPEEAKYSRRYEPAESASANKSENCRLLPEGACPHATVPLAVSLPGSLPPDYNPSHVKYLEVQDLASQLTGLICAPQPGETWWDACAGAGGKTLHLADLMDGTGIISATDIRHTALLSLQKRRSKHNPADIRCGLWNGTQANLPEMMFDGVLLDASCSGLGTWHRMPDARYRATEEQIARHAVRQKRMLQLAATRVKPGGKLIYAVCTMTKTETVEVADEFTADQPEFTPLPGKHPLTSATTNGQTWIWPWEGNCNGMFIAIWHRH